MVPARWVFLALWAVFYGAYFIKMLALRHQGVMADILGKGAKPRSRAAFERAMKAVTYIGAAVQAASAVFPGCYSLGGSAAGRAVGLVFAALGGAIFIAAMSAMGINWRAGFSAGQAIGLVTSGIYRISRNPAFLGFDLLYAAFALAFPNPATIALAAVAMILFHVQILGEENFLADTFGAQYLSYKSKTRRYFGKRKG